MLFEYPCFLILLVLFCWLLYRRDRRYSLRHAYTKSISSPSKFWPRIQTILLYLGLFILILAAANLVIGYEHRVNKRSVHRYVLINDGSGSMVDVGKDRGVGEYLSVVHAGNKSFLDALGRRKDGSKDMVGTVVFSNNAYIVSYIIDDFGHIEKLLNRVDYTLPPLGQGTETDKAIWCGLEMLLAQSEDMQDDMKKIKVLMYGGGRAYKKDLVTEETIRVNKPKVEGASLIIFTDGQWFYWGDRTSMSTYKLLGLCKDLGVRVYLLTVEKIDNDVIKYVNDTGGFSLFIDGFDQNKFNKSYTDIVEQQAKEQISVVEKVDRRLGTYFGYIALTMLIFGTVVKWTINRTYTEV